jgi:predicted dehydrogenase
MTLRSGDIHIPKINMAEPLKLECEHFIDCVRTGQTPRSDGRNGLAVVEIMAAAGRSLTSGGVQVEIG